MDAALLRTAYATRLTPSKYNLALPAAWRWERVLQMKQENRRIRKNKEDDWTQLAHKFYNELEKVKGVSGFERLSAKYGSLYWAWYWWNMPSQQTRWTIEAYLLAGASMAEIADRVHQHPEMPLIYSKLFFDVVGKRRHWAYILNEVIGPSIHAGVSDRKYDLLWKLFGLIKGPKFLDYLMRHEFKAGEVTGEASGIAAVDDLTRDGLRVKTLYASRTIPVEYHNYEIIFATYGKLCEIEKKSEGKGGVQNLLMNNVHSMICQFGFKPGQAPGLIKPYLANGVEMRAKDQTLVALGGKPQLMLTNDAFPEPVQKEKAEVEV